MRIDRRIGASMARQSRKDTPAEIAWRLANNEVLAQVLAERAQRPALTAENVKAELEWQGNRIQELMKLRGF